MEIKTVRTISVPNPPTKEKTETTRQKSDMQRLAESQRKAKVDRYLEQERNRAVRPQIDQLWTLWVLVGLSILSFITSAVLVANGTIAVATFMGLAIAWMAWLVFGAIELMILVTLLGYLIIGSRIDEETGKPADASLWFWVMVSFSAITILANGFHTLEHWNFAWGEPRMWAGIVLSMIVPFSFILVSKMLSVVVFAKPIFMDVPKLGRPKKNE